MRVNNTFVDTLAPHTPAGSTQKLSQQSSLSSASSAPVAAADQASLSSAANLVALAKTATSSDRQAKINSLTEQVRSGNYQGSVSRAGQAMVNELLQTSTSAAKR
jgi:anti-sigma28 factor (negative regulator of flagellin synthesis)